MRVKLGICAALCAVLVAAGAGAAPPAKTAPSKAKPATAPAPAAAAGKLANIKLDIPATRYVLKNGLTLIVHEDHKAPIVTVNIWYHVGSKNEPAGRSGFAHLFEHLMFNGSEHFNDDFFKATQKLGATHQNGSTSEDRTNYFQDVPKGALDTILWLESDRMGYLLGAVDQPRLDEQRGVVQNEKREGENQPYGEAFNLITKATYPPEHPYGHTVIGSMDDLDAAKLEQVREWFRTYYGPSNAVLVLAGDITPEEAKAKVEKYFGEIPSGPPVAHPKVWVAKRSGAQREIYYDRVAQPRLYKVWNTPQYGSRDADLLEVFADVLSGDLSSRLDKRLVHDEQILTNVGIISGASEIAGQFMIIATGKPGADMDRVEREIDEEIASLTTAGPRPDELEKARARSISGLVRQTEAVSSKAQILAESQTYLGDFNGWKRSLEVTRTATPKAVADAGRRWLTDGSYSLLILPFGDFTASATRVDRSKPPVPAGIAAAQFPKVQRATLSNGLKVLLVERHETPVVNLQLLVDSGYGADFAQTTPGVGGMATALIMEGTTHRQGLQITDQLVRLGADMNAGGGGETSTISLSALKPTLDEALNIFADVIQNPAFRMEDFKRVQAQQIAGLQRTKRDPNGAAGRVFRSAFYSPNHPYGRLSTEASLAAVTREDVVRFHQRWFKPNNASLVVVGDTSLAELTPKLEAALAGWKPGPVEHIAIPPVPPPAKPVVYLVDRPGSQQSIIMAGVPAPPRNARDEIRLGMFNTIFGGDFMSRINMNLREDKHWSYGSRSSINGDRGPRIFSVTAPVQTDKTAESIREVQKEMRQVTKDHLITADELTARQADTVLSLAGDWETDRGVAGSLNNLILYRLPDDYYSGYAERVQALSANEVAGVAGTLVPNPDNLVWVIVGDRAKIEAGVRQLNLGEIHIVDADGKPVG